MHMAAVMLNAEKTNGSERVFVKPEDDELLLRPKIDLQ